KMTRAQKLAFAMSAAPPEIARHATVMDMTDMSKPKQLRAGTNGWICYAMILGTNNEAMCLDKQWQNWAAAWMNKTEPKIEGTGKGPDNGGQVDWCRGVLLDSACAG